MTAPCSCGDARPHVIVERRTADGVRVLLWSDGDVTGWAGHRLGPRVRDLDVARVMMDEVCLEHRSAVGDLVRAAARVARSKVREPAAVRAAVDRVRRIGHVSPGHHYTATTGADGLVRVGRERRS